VKTLLSKVFPKYYVYCREEYGYDENGVMM